MSNCGNVNERLDSVIKAIEGLKHQVPATDWTQANTLRLVGELANICRELASTGTGETLQPGQRIVKNRKGELDKLLWMAVKALPPGTGPERRDAFIQHVLTSWNVSASEMATLGYGKA